MPPRQRELRRLREPPKTVHAGRAVLGQHTFEVRAIDEAGNTDATPASHRWTVLDTTAPDTTITAQPPASTTDTNASFGFSASDKRAAA